MGALIVFAAYLLIEKLMETVYGIVQMHVQERIQWQQTQVRDVEEPEDERQIGFQNYGGTMMRVEDDDED